ncbi:MAG: UDP-N-acetylmuramoyl-tripeptide--D-alanyl-D-alanine ligase [Zetaproteobacteria bacterium CG12_big_fil_rev_8_21_14_0_65_54_13]|nr:MAG: UDP-N-acetylmuramoyl-tripeptide--D-alanyl-D-alanine ligase [Zetaproteobacteria bacterium CG23_combo_of_CG06-09_8_20_14_all_54_7]PIW44024.1 MAG: UDP-N-acetylmuramoyl-tripeptide--D-alanyl-D-alanine ligase [Zetaproteobacteria bacterium CG12_big_fil_rev_8_21_14_0_65_54_13]PIX54357.1 MAG: UDP-N-acetylmuramoyl-tripeptide--D-alanyl-D-alanine ligase [Zetaproteobacteria bacterium CG_4_10_14_3_um_filter_54_28]PJA28560.1 MAG: UDP-N-acetylmuramoyl-tripeptide--D-alanyl-D-alanine ligase [Zetaproteobac
MRLSGADIQRATGGEWLHGTPARVSEITTDTRDFHAGQCFLALRGPNFDGHHFAVPVADRACALIGDARGARHWSELAVPQLLVTDTLQALGDIAHAWRMQLERTQVVAISGSFGKTSVRSLLQHGLSMLGVRVAATTANLNNLVGVPKTLLAVPADADVALIECGISEIGEMQRLSAIVQPDIAVLTGITSAHSEGLGGLAGVVAEKAKLFTHLNPGAWCALGAGVAGQLSRYQVTPPSDLLDVEQAELRWRLEGQCLHFKRGDEQAEIKLALPARHWAANMHLAACIIMRLMADVRLHDVVAALASWQPPAGRMQVLTGSDGCTVLDDSYNANPISMQAALDTLKAMPGCRVAVLGDMAELGQESKAAHTGLDVSGIDRLYLVGSKMHDLAIGSSSARWYPDHRAAAASLSRESFGPEATVLVKASRSMALEAVVNVLCASQNAEVQHAV